MQKNVNIGNSFIKINKLGVSGGSRKLNKKILILHKEA